MKSKPARKTRHTANKRYAYIMSITETVEYKTMVVSTRRLKYEEIEKEAEKRRIANKMLFNGVKDVKMYCERAYVNGRQSKKAIAH